MQIPIASSLYYTTVVIRRPEIWGPNFYSPFFQYRQCFHENIINNHSTNHKNYDATFSTYFNSIGKKYTPCQGVAWSQYSLPGTFYVPFGFGVVFFAKVCFFLPVQFWKAVAIDLHWLCCTQILSYNISWTTALILMIFSDSDC